LVKFYSTLLALDLFSYIWAVVLLLQSLPTLIWMTIVFALLPVVTALPDEGDFPTISFKVFSKFVEANFSSRITLPQVLLVLFTITDNPELLSLHARQQNPKYNGETRTLHSGWIKCLARGLQERLGEKDTRLFKHHQKHTLSKKEMITDISGKLDALAKLLNLYPCNSAGQFQGKLKSVSYASIQAVQVICPHAVECETTTCNPRSLLQITRLRDIPRVTLIKGSKMHENVQVLTGHCPSCQTTYLADRERVLQSDNRHTRVYLNSAKYLKVGQSLWVDRVFSNTVLNGMYSFHASASAFTEFWNNSFWSAHSGDAKKITRRQVWQSFVQESIRSIAAVSNINVELQDGLAIEDVTREAFSLLGENGIIRAADQHACDECTQAYKSVQDILPNIDPAALVGVDENRAIPELVEDIDQTAMQIADQMEQNSVRTQTISSNEEDMNVDHAPVKMAVVDGIVMGPSVCLSFISYYI